MRASVCLHPPPMLYEHPHGFELALSMMSATEGATLYYTLDGSVPSYISKVFDPAHPLVINHRGIVPYLGPAPALPHTGPGSPLQGLFIATASGSRGLPRKPKVLGSL